MWKLQTPRSIQEPYQIADTLKCYTSCKPPVDASMICNISIGYLVNIKSATKLAPHIRQTKATSFDIISHELYYEAAAVNDLTAEATSVVASCSHSLFCLSSSKVCSAMISYSFLETSRLISAYCSFVISAFLQCELRAVFTILLMPSLEDADMVARTGEISPDRGRCTGCRLVGRGWRSSKVLGFSAEVGLFGEYLLAR